MDNQKNLIRFFPFALTRIERLRDYLNRMYESGYQIVKIKFKTFLQQGSSKKMGRCRSVGKYKSAIS